MPDFSVVIASYNEGTQLLATMSAVKASFTGEADVELVVTNDCSSDGSGEYATGLAAKLAGPGLAIKVVRTARRYGTERAKNYGQRQTSGPICVTLDAHSVPARGALERMVAPMTTDPDLVITGPIVATLPQPSAAEMLSDVWGIPDLGDLEHGRLANLKDPGSMDFGFGLRLEDPSLSRRSRRAQSPSGRTTGANGARTRR